MGFNLSKSRGGSGRGSCSTGAVPRSNSWGMRRSGSGFGGLSSSIFRSGAVTGVEVDVGCPFLELQYGGFVKLMGVCGGCGIEGVAVETIGERARVELSGEALSCGELELVGSGEAVLGGPETDNSLDCG